MAKRCHTTLTQKATLAQSLLSQPREHNTDALYPIRGLKHHLGEVSHDRLHLWNTATGEELASCKILEKSYSKEASPFTAVRDLLYSRGSLYILAQRTDITGADHGTNLFVWHSPFNSGPVQLSDDKDRRNRLFVINDSLLVARENNHSGATIDRYKRNATKPESIPFENPQPALQHLGLAHFYLQQKSAVPDRLFLYRPRGFKVEFDPATLQPMQRSNRPEAQRIIQQGEWNLWLSKVDGTNEIQLWTMGDDQPFGERLAWTGGIMCIPGGVYVHDRQLNVLLYSYSRCEMIVWSPQKALSSPLLRLDDRPSTTSAVFNEDGLFINGGKQGPCRVIDHKTEEGLGNRLWRCAKGLVAGNNEISFQPKPM